MEIGILMSKVEKEGIRGIDNLVMESWSYQDAFGYEPRIFTKKDLSSRFFKASEHVFSVL